jgi:DNA-binding transcriptional regulator YhcF (GntR family)
VQRYFNSTPIKNAFARWMTYGVYTNRFYTITELVKEMHSNRQTISTMINECEAEGFIVVKRKGSTVACQASDLLVEKMEEYCEWRKELTRSTIGTAYNRLVQFEKLMQKRFT